MASPTAKCPSCNNSSDKIKSHYDRRMREMSWCSIPVKIHLTVRRFICINSDCSQKIFCERIPELVPAHGRRTVRFNEMISVLTRNVSAETASRLAGDLGVPTSADTVLRIIRETPESELSTPRVLGVDDWAWRKGRSYGTILINLETHAVVELLNDRKASTFQKWLEDHPGIEVISRDRAPGFSEAAKNGAPNARQIADRWHLLKNLGDALERWFQRIRSRLAYTVTSIPKEEVGIKDSSFPQLTSGQKNCQARFEEIQNLKKQGFSLRHIARKLNMSRKTVRKYVNAEQCPYMIPRKPTKTLLDDYHSYLQSRLVSGCRNSRILFEEIKEMGYKGSRSNLANWIRKQLKNNQPQEDENNEQAKTLTRKISPRRLQHWFMTPLQDLTRIAVEPMNQIFKANPELQKGYTLVRHFHTMVRHRGGHALNAWLKAAQNSGISELKRFAESINKDFEAVYAGLTESWSQGPVEGINNKLKLIKRIMYGRARFDLLRKRVIFAT